MPAKKVYYIVRSDMFGLIFHAFNVVAEGPKTFKIDDHIFRMLKKEDKDVFTDERLACQTFLDQATKRREEMMKAVERLQKEMEKVATALEKTQKEQP